MDPRDDQFSILRATLDASLDAIFVISRDKKRILLHNQRFDELWSVPSEIQHSNDHQAFFAFLAEQLVDPTQWSELLKSATGQPHPTETRQLQLKNGQRLDLHAKALDLNSENAGWMWTFRESARTSQLDFAESDQSLFKNKDFLEKILCSLPSLISYVSRDYRYLYLNSTYEKWWGISEEDYIGKPIQELTGEERFQAYKPFLDAALSGETISYEAEVTYPVAGAKSAQINYIPHVGESGMVEGVFVIIHDITDLKKTEQELVLKEQFLNQVVEHIPSALFLKDSKNEMKITLWNRAAEKIFGIPRDLALGQTSHDVFATEQAHFDCEMDQKVITQGQSIYSPEIVGQTHDAQPIYLQMMKVPIRCPETHEIQMVLSLVTDITNEREAHRALLQSAKMSSLGEMASGIAHEINNPLAIINLNADSICEKILSGRTNASEFLDSMIRIKKTSERIAKIVRSLRAFSRNSQADPMQTVSLNHLLDDTLELCRERFKIQGVEIRTLIEADIRIECRAPQISQVLMNLLNNAYDAVLPLTEKWIELKVACDGSDLLLTVTDSGLGISPQLQDKIMQPFFTTKDVGKGTGLGLSISKGIAEEHSGELFYDMKSAHTRFVLRLPLRQMQITEMELSKPQRSHL